jgi:hypothetical protein
MATHSQSTICCDCLRVVSDDWSEEVFECRASLGVVGEEEQAPGGPTCPHCGSAALAGLSRHFEVGIDLTGLVRLSRCRECGQAVKVVDTETGAVLLQDAGCRDGRCKDCRLKHYLEAHADPSSADKRFRLDERRVLWRLNKVKVRCPVCGRDRWLPPGGAWKEVCERCFRGRNEETRASSG